ncbi:MAG: hypothetical protein M1827_005643 [Pycnora praestabilis]|nr:MAG: hypothetical protein M1827_005643 [Pycnora praestabilis]
MTTDMPCPSSKEVENGPMATKAKLSILDLPIETQKDIFEHSSSSDLIALALVSRHFHLIACAQLYRTFSIVFPDEDDPAFDSPIDGLAGGLDTIVTSEHNYAKYLKEIIMDTLSGADRGERAYRHYLYEVSCGKFLNTLILLTLRKARALETFHWNIRVELSRPVLSALHNTPSLRRLHIRLQAGPSLYEKPPPLPLSSTSSIATSLTSSYPPAIPPNPPPPYSVAKTPPKPSANGLTLMNNARSDPPTFSAFKNLTHLTVLDMDTLDYISEIRGCIHSSSSTLKSLKLSLSEALARKSRKPRVEDSDESDQEIDEFGNTLAPPPPPPPIVGGEGTQEKETKMRTERLAQEAILGKLFDLEKAPPADEQQQNSDDDDADEGEKAKPEDDPVQTFIVKINSLTTKLMEATSFNSTAHRTQKQKDLMKAIETATKDYSLVAKESHRKSSNTVEATGNQSALNDIIVAGDEKVESKVESMSMEFAEPEDVPKTNEKGKGKLLDALKPTSIDESDEAPEGPGLFDKPNTEFKAGPHTELNEKVVDEIDIDHPDIVEVDDEEEQEHVDEPDVASSTVNGATSSADELTVSGALANGTGKATETPPSQDLAVREYIRSTRKLALDNLSLYLVPIKASVLSRAIDLTALRRITLLNVGLQDPFWTLMTKKQKKSHLNVRSIYTDNISPSFVTFVNNLESISELFMLERTTKSKIEALAPKTSISIEEIRKQILKKHIKSLKKLMIVNDSDKTWDINTKTMKLITNAGGNLSELEFSTDLRSFHLLLQYLPGLLNLKALHITSFRTDDTCTWVMRELRKFAADHVAHHPRMKLEYIGLDNMLDRLIRIPKVSKGRKGERKDDAGSGAVEVDASKTDSSGKDIGKGEDEDKDKKIIGEASSDNDSSTDDDSDDEYKRPELKVETSENFRFYDVVGVRIFRKDVRAGRL